ncbi:MAG: hypothetical protein EA428_09640 [Spirochaetaceae bacterium]|nr:MAG: hypothetical protein EA428_09640 [Spirochaetaceae bacterium]
MEFRFGKEKNDWLVEHRGVCFEDVISAIADRGVLLDFENPNQEKYPSRRFRYLVEGDEHE